VIQSAAQNPAVDIDKMERLLAMHERIVWRVTRKRRGTTPWPRASPKCARFHADAFNPQTKQASTPAIPALDRAAPVYASHGFSL
jgi:hypothetical protein